MIYILVLISPVFTHVIVLKVYHIGQIMFHSTCYSLKFVNIIKTIFISNKADKDTQDI